MCLVETGERSPTARSRCGRNSCPPARRRPRTGTSIVTDSPKVKDAQAQALEDLLLNHPLDCPACDQAGECLLQDYSYRFGHAHSRMHEPKIRRQDKDYIGDQITLFTDRCVMCSRCVRFTREISGTAEMQVINRGSHAEIDIFPGQPVQQQAGGQRGRHLPGRRPVQQGFSLQAARLVAQVEAERLPQLQHRLQHFGRPEQRDRLPPAAAVEPEGPRPLHVRRGAVRFQIRPQSRPPGAADRPVSNGRPANDWNALLPAVQTALPKRPKPRPAALAAVLSPWMTCEEAYLLAKYMKSLAPAVRLAMGPVRVVGEDDHYPKRINGQPAEPITFTIRAEKCPNRAGVAEILKHFEGKVVSFDELKSQVAAGEIDSLYAVGGDREPWVTDADRTWLSKLKLLIVQDILPSPASELAHYVLPAGSFVEKDGTFINHAGLAQTIERSVRGPGESRPDGRILWDLAGRRGLFHAATVRAEIGSEIESLAAFRSPSLGPTGRLLSEVPALRIRQRPPRPARRWCAAYELDWIYAIIAIVVVLGGVLGTCAI